jgi:Holliday junction resolvase RusA-like endonuclease
MAKAVFNITPIGKPRMVRSDAWKKRPAVLRYWQFKERLNIQAKMMDYKVEETIDVVFVLPMPESWSKKKRDTYCGGPHQSTPDIDNLCKAFFDCLCQQDSFIYDIKALKIWGEIGKIIIRNGQSAKNTQNFDLDF